jgi:hypothetical protein
MLSTCQGKIVRAHTVARTASLQRIAEKGHVLTLMPTMGAFIKNEGKIKPIRTGVNIASTFAGFCALHDRELFSPIENHPFRPVPEHVFLVSYRAFCREQYNKVAHANLPTLLREADAGRSVHLQAFIQNMASDSDLGIQAALRDNAVYKRLLDEMLLSRDYSRMSGLVLVLNGAPPIMASGCLWPTHDHKNNVLQDLFNLNFTPDMLFVNLFSSDDAGYCVLSWLDDFQTAPTRLIKTLLDEVKENIGSLLIQMIFKWIENLYMRESWWNELDDESKYRFILFYRESADPLVPVRFDNFNISAALDFPPIRDIVHI